MRFCKRGRGIAGIVERCIEDSHVELRWIERQGVEIGLNGRKSDRVVTARTKAVGLVVELVHRCNVVARFRQPVRQPAIAGAEIEDAERARLIRQRTKEVPA